MYADAENLVRQGYLREVAAIRSAAVLAEDTGWAAKIDNLAGVFVTTGEQSDLARLKAYAGAVGVSPRETVRSADEEKAARMVPVRLKPAPTGPAGGGGGAPRVDPAEASRQQYNAMEMRGFADGKRSILEIRNGLSAEYGPQPVGKVVAFFEGMAKTGEFEIRTR